MIRKIARAIGLRRLYFMVESIPWCHAYLGIVRRYYHAHRFANAAFSGPFLALFPAFLLIPPPQRALSASEDRRYQSIRRELAEAALAELVEDYLKASVVDPQRYCLKGSRWAAPDLGFARQQLDETLRAEPDFAEMRYLSGTLHLEAGDTDSAIREWKAASCAKSRLPPYYYDIPVVARINYELATLLVARGEYDEAEACLRSAISLRSDMTRAHRALAELLLRKGRPQEAAAHMVRAIAIYGSGDTPPPVRFEEAGG